mmetsp:Transcript_113437/g.326160  ORF Transcript_113437/g.326160 Transcript_113437/m.326160 type:complete len:338 (-) Transcript_113437:315-1328(-)
MPARARGMARPRSSRPGSRHRVLTTRGAKLHTCSPQVKLEAKRRIPRRGSAGRGSACPRRGQVPSLRQLEARGNGERHAHVLHGAVLAAEAGEQHVQRVEDSLAVPRITGRRGRAAELPGEPEASEARACEVERDDGAAAAQQRVHCRDVLEQLEDVVEIDDRAGQKESNIHDQNVHRHAEEVMRQAHREELRHKLSPQEACGKREADLRRGVQIETDQQEAWRERAERQYKQARHGDQGLGRDVCQRAIKPVRNLFPEDLVLHAVDGDRHDRHEKRGAGGPAEQHDPWKDLTLYALPRLPIRESEESAAQARKKPARRVEHRVAHGHEGEPPRQNS